MPGPSSARLARRLVRDALIEHGFEDDSISVAELLTSEIVTNSLVHAGGASNLYIDVDDRVIRIAVDDRGSGVPVKRRFNTFEESGRGMAIVDVLSSAWGVEKIAGDGKRVWFELKTPAES